MSDSMFLHVFYCDRSLYKSPLEAWLEAQEDREGEDTLTRHYDACREVAPSTKKIPYQEALSMAAKAARDDKNSREILATPFTDLEMKAGGWLFSWYGDEGLDS